MSALALLALLGATALLIGCVRISNGVWYARSAPLPEGWPTLTPVGEVAIRDYPVYRAAAVRESDLDETGMGPMFMTLFRHIKEEDIAMTSPVDMSWSRTGNTPQTQMDSMAFVYRSTDLGAEGSDGPVTVSDREPATFASVGVRGGYSARNFGRGIDALDAWLESNAQWRVDGEPRYLGYNGPFTPPFFRYGEVQVPVVPTPDASDPVTN